MRFIAMPELFRMRLPPPSSMSTTMYLSEAVFVCRDMIECWVVEVRGDYGFNS